MTENVVAPTPGSPGLPPVQHNDIIQELFKYVLQSHVNGTLGSDLGLSSQFCSGLLLQDAADPASSDPLFAVSSDTTEGVPPYPLYKRLAASLHEWLNSGSFSSLDDNVPTLCEDDSLKLLKDEWNELVLQKGSELINILKSVTYEVNVQEPYFTLLKDGQKTVEGRLAVGNYTCMQSGDLLLFNKCLLLEVLDVHRYSSFREMLQAETLEKVLPGVQTIEEGVQVYRKFYTEEKEKLNGVVAIVVSRPVPQPYSILSDIISGLSYRGVQSLLGLKQTVGTIPEALIPPRSTLLSSFMLPYNPDVAGSTLTVGARALTKHINRCSSNYWGKLEGDDSTKNFLAKEVISRIMVHCTWMNLHIVHPHDAVFEIRAPEGYGARWSEDGTKFIGFLEPHMEVGHSTKWRH